MIAARMGHTATLLKNGKVLLAGGTDTNGTALGDLFDPATATFSPTATGGTQNLWLAAASLQDGKAFLAGGEFTALVSGPPRGCLFGPVSSALAISFRTSDESFFAIGHLSAPRAFHTATRLGNGEVLIVGGATVRSALLNSKLYTSVTPLASAELFNPSSVSFT